ncbi:hypothetical protein [Amycolatopsis sp. cmx-4-54]|uniref:hypothetical protein n=1 Tax=Amycolatopsis sp. cmx-4-54 TaxID=2790936 RepID=UPI003979DC62
MTSPTIGWGLLHWIRRRRRHSVVTGNAPVTQLGDVRALVCAFDLPATVTPEDLAARLSTVRGRSILIQPYPENIVAESRRTGDPLPYGVWVSGAASDFVFFRQDTTNTHQRHILLHELGHIACRHVQAEAEAGTADTGGVDGVPDLQMIRRAVKRDGEFAEAQEQAAETFAYLIERQTRPTLSATGDTPSARYRLLEDS